MKLTKRGFAASYVVFALCLNASVIFTLVGTQNPAILTAINYSLSVAALLLVLTVPYSTSRTLLNNPSIFLLYLWTSASILWAPDPLRVLRVIGTVWPLLLCGVLGAYFLGFRGAVTTIRRTIVTLAAASAVVQAIHPMYSGPSGPMGVPLAPGWTGIYGEKNHFGAGMAVGCVAILASPEPWGWRKVLQFGLCSVLLVGSQSATAIGIVLILLPVYLFLQLKPRAKPLFLIAVAGSAVLAAAFIPNLVDHLFKAAGKNTNLTGRDVIWAFVWKYWKQRLWLGYGTFSFWDYHDAEAQMELHWNPGESHNGFLEMGVTVGLIGIAFLLAALAAGLALIRRAFLEGQVLVARWLLFSWIALMIGNITEADFMVPGPIWFAYCIVYFVTYTEVTTKQQRSVQPRNKEGAFERQLHPGFALSDPVVPGRYLS